MGKGFDIQMPPDITMDERIFLISHLKVPEDKLRGRVYTRDRTREKIRQTKSTIVDDYKLYAEARDAVRFRLDRLQTGDWSRLGYPQAWDSDPVFSSRLDVYQKEFVKVVGDTRASTAVAAFVQGAADLARLRDQVDTLSHDIVGFEVVAAAEAEEAAPIPLASVPEDQQRAILQARVAGHAPPEAPPNAVERASLDGRDLRRMDLVAQERIRLDTAEAALTARKTALETLRDATPAPDPQDALRIRAELTQIAAQTVAVGDRKATLNAFDAGFAAREEGKAAMAAQQAALHGLADAEPDAIGAALATLAGGEGLVAEVAAGALERGEAKVSTDATVVAALDAQLQSNIAALRATVTADVTTPLPGTTRMYLTEPDVMCLSAAQAGELNALLAHAETLRSQTPPAVKDAWAMYELASAMRRQFQQQRQMPTPEPRPVSDLHADLTARIRSVMVDLDRFWGQGGDDTALRPVLVSIRDRLVGADGDPALFALERELDEFCHDLANARMAFRPAAPAPGSDEELRAQEAATRARALNSKLLDVYQTEAISGTDIARVDRSLLIIIPGTGTDPDQFYRIKTEEYMGATVPRLKDKKIPRETASALRETANLLDDLSHSTIPGLGDSVVSAAGDADLLTANLTDESLAIMADIKSGISKCRSAAADSRFETYEPAELKTRLARVASIESSYPKAGDLAGLLTELIGSNVKKPDGGLHQAFKDMSQQAKVDERAYGDATKALDRIDKQLNGKTGWFSNKTTIGTAMSNLRALEDKLASRLAGQVSGWLEPAERENVMRALNTILTSLTTLKETEEAGVRYAGRFATASTQARTQLERKTTADIRAAADKIETLQADIADALDKMPDISALEKFAKGKVESLGDAANLRELMELSGFLEDAASGATEMKAALDSARASQDRAREELEEASTALENVRTYYTLLKLNIKTKHKHPRHGEYDDLRADFDEASKALDAGDDPARAKAAFDRIAGGAVSLQKIDPNAGKKEPVTGPIAFDPGAARNRAKAAVDSLVGGIDAFATGLVGRADTDDETRQATAVAAMLKKVGTLAGAADAMFAGSFETDLAAAGQDDVSDSERTAATRKLRETGLAQLRALQAAVEAHPAVQIYRGNPSDGLIIWTPFRKSLFDVELALTRDLN